jgi:dolichyl-phosphate beta-glucosyltransferase
MANTTVIVVPCYNEAERLPVDTFRSYAGTAQDVRFHFVDDGSTDGTPDLLHELEASDPHQFSFHQLPWNRGKGEAVRSGILRAFDLDPSYVGFWDADLATPLEDIEVFREVLETSPGKEIVFGSRVNLLGRSIRRNLVRHWIGRIFATLAVGVIRVPIYDTQCGAKLFRATDEIRALFEDPFSSKWVFDLEIVARLRNARRDGGGPLPKDVIVEHPLMLWHDIAGSKIRLRDFVVVGIDLLRIHLRYNRK